MIHYIRQKLWTRDGVTDIDSTDLQEEYLIWREFDIILYDTADIYLQLSQEFFWLAAVYLEVANE
jgi:hypothetical protein